MFGGLGLAPTLARSDKNAIILNGKQKILAAADKWRAQHLVWSRAPGGVENHNYT